MNLLLFFLLVPRCELSFTSLLTAECHHPSNYHLRSSCWIITCLLSFNRCSICCLTPPASSATVSTSGYRFLLRRGFGGSLIELSGVVFRVFCDRSGLIQRYV